MLKLFFKMFGRNGVKGSILNLNENEIRNILIVRQHNQLGDMLCSVPLFAAVRKRFPKAHITLVASPINYEILFSDINPYIDKVITYHKAPLSRLLDFYRELKNHDYQIGIVPSTVSISRTSHFINFFSGAGIRVGVKSIDEKQNTVEYLLNVKSDFKWDSRKLHQVERNLEVGSQIDCSLTESELENVKIHLSREEEEFAEEFVRNSFGESNKPLIAFHPGAGKVPNRWNRRNFVSLIKVLKEKYDCDILLTSGNIDKEITHEIVNGLKEINIECVVLENTPIRKVGAVLKMSDCYITNDTGTMHVAGGVGARVVSLFGPTKGFEWAPRGEDKIYIQSPTSNIDDIKVDDVLKAADKLLSGIIRERNHTDSGQTVSLKKQ